jgi:NADH pyrophosphatase NudC (nudix superfamily)
MAEYITKEQAYNSVDERIDELRADKEFNIVKEICISGVKKHIETVPTADVRLVVRGKWIEETHNGREVDVCSNCQHIMHKEPTWHFCPLCGAEMREVSEDGNKSR